MREVKPEDKKDDNRIYKYENIIGREFIARTPEPKFRKGDWVSVVSFFNDEKIYKSKPYEIVDLNYNIGNYPVKACWEYCLDDKDSGKFWRKEANLELVPDYELDAMKYNL